MIIRENDSVKLKDGRIAGVLMVFEDTPLNSYLLEVEGKEELYDQITLEEDKIEEVVYSPYDGNERLVKTA